MPASSTAPALRSAAWFGAPGKVGFIHRAWLKGDGLPDDVFDGRPVVGIANSWSQLTPCNSSLGRVAAAVARGVWEAGGLPLEFPTMSIGETLMRPTSMMFRNMMAMEVEEVLRANPLDSVVLLGGCDKTVPAQIMGAASVDLPAIVVTAGPKLTGKYNGQDIGSGTDLWKFADQVRTGDMTQEDFVAAEICMSRSEGHCMSMATASTMAILTEALGLQLPGSSAVPAVDARRFRLAQESGRLAVALAKERRCLSSVVGAQSLENAVKVLAAIGGSTNAVLHLIAFAGRLGLDMPLDAVDQWAHDTPLLVNLKPAGQYVMEDFYYAGGTPALVYELLPLLHGDAMTVTGRTLAEEYTEVDCWNREVIAALEDPFQPAGSGIAVLRGNLCPDGAIIKQAAASPRLLRHRGPALVFDSYEDLEAVIDDMTLDVEADTVLVLRNAGPRGYPGMPEVGNLPVPRKLLEQGITDIVRISDARMSGSSYGTVVLHVAPEAAAGGPLALLRSGDMVELDVEQRSLNVAVSDGELAHRRESWTAPVERPTAATHGCTTNMFSKRIAARTSTFSWAGVATLWDASPSRASGGGRLLSKEAHLE